MKLILTRAQACVVVVCLALGLAAAWHLTGRAARPAPAAAASRVTGAEAAADVRQPAEKEKETRRVRAVESYGKLPLRFEANAGQTDGRVKFVARGQGYALFLTPNEAVLRLARQRAGRTKAGQPPLLAPDSRADFAGFNVSLRDSLSDERAAGDDASAVLTMRVAGANPAPRVSGLERLAGESHYLIGDDSRRWRTGVRGYAKVRYEAVYPGVDLVYYGNQRQLEYDFVVQPGADAGRIKLAFAGADAIKVDADGALALSVAGDEVKWLRPVAWQEADGRRREVACDFKVEGDSQVGFALGDYDRRLPLVIDPVLVYSTFVGGTGSDEGLAVAVDKDGNAYLTGATLAQDFPGASPIQGTRGSGAEAYVLKLNPAGTQVVYATWLGGNNTDRAYAIAVDAGGQAFVTGGTLSTNFPTTTGAMQRPTGDGFDTFVAKLNLSGSALVYSAVFGGSGSDQAYGLALDADGNAYVAGTTSSVNLPATGIQTARRGSPVYTSNDRGANWAAGGGISSVAVNSFAFSPSGDAVYATTNRNVFKSTDGGRQWRDTVSTGANPFTYGVDAVVVDPATPTTLYAATFIGVWKTTDGGATWQVKNTGLNFGLPWVHALAIDPSAPGTLYAATESGVWKTTDGAEKWTESNAGIGVTSGGGFRPPRSFHLALDPTNPATVYVGTERGVYKTTNGGGLWATANAGLANPSGGAGFGPGVDALVMSPTSPATLYLLADYPGGLYRTTDGGARWSLVSEGIPGTWNGQPARYALLTVAIDPTASATLYATATDGRVHKSTDGGATWTPSDAGLLNLPANTLAVDRNGNVYAGTNSGADAFVAKLNASGSALGYLTYLGGEKFDSGAGITVDAQGNAYVIGTTDSTNFPTASPLQAASGGFADAYVTKINSAGTALVWSTYLGGALNDKGGGIALDAAGRLWLAGETNSENFPTVNSLQALNKGVKDPYYSAPDAFIARLDLDGAGVKFATYLGGSGFDTATKIALDAAGNAYVTGHTGSDDFPALGAAQAARNNGQVNSSNVYDAFVAKLTVAGPRLAYATFFGGRGQDYGYAIAVDAAGNAYVAGNTASQDFPVVGSSVHPFRGAEAFITKLAVSADLAVTIADSPDPVMANNPLTYTLTVKNNGPDGASDVTLTDTLPSGVTLVSSTPSQGTCGGAAEVKCELGEIKGGAQATVTVVVTPAAPGTLTNRASVTSSTPDLKSDNNSATHETKVSSSPSVYGRVTAMGGAGLVGVTLTVTGASAVATTAADGSYQLAELAAGGSYTVTPVKQGFVFNPPSVTFTNLAADRRADFAAVGCVFTLTPVNQAFPAAGGTGSIAVNSPDAQCPWTARSNASWITLTSAASGQGSATLNFSVAATTAARSGTITVAGRTFTVWQEVNPSATPSFVVAEKLAAGKSPGAMTAGDFNKDGRVDVAVANEGPPTISVLLNEGGGHFSEPVSYPCYGHAKALVTADLNGDGVLDLIAANGQATVLLGLGGGRFGAFKGYDTGGGASALALGDFNADGKPDVVTANEQSNNLGLLLGDGAGGFIPPNVIGGTGVIFTPRDVVTGDFTGDGRLDFVVIDTITTSLFPGNGAGGFGTKQGINSPISVTALAAGDFNRDGRPDLALGITEDSTGKLAVMLGAAGGGFSAPTKVNLTPGGGGGPQVLKVGDLNGDSKPDLAAVFRGTYEILPLLNDGAGNFAPGERFTTGMWTQDAVIADFTGDGRGDLITSTPGRVNGPGGLLSLLAGRGDGSFVSAPAFSGPPRPSHAASGDFNGDGKLDLILLGGNCEACSNNGTLMVKFGDGRGGFLSSTSYEVGVKPNNLALGDFNGDGRPDVAVTNYDSASVSLLIGNAVGFNPATKITVGEKPRAVVAGDFNGDGKADLVVSYLPYSQNNNISVLLGDGAGGFGAPGNIPVDGPYLSLAAGDLNGDGRLDLVASDFTYCDSSQPKLYLMLGQGNGTFAAARKFGGVSTSSILVYDFDGDGNLDVGTANACQDKLTILLGDGAGNLPTAKSYTIGFVTSSNYRPRVLSLGDFNGDGRADIVATGHDTVEVMTGDGGGGFSAAVSFIAGPAPSSAAAGDFNGDGRADLAVANGGGYYESGSLTLLLNNSAPSNRATSASAASYDAAALAPEVITSVFGVNLATATVAAQSLPLPTELAGTVVKVRDSAGIERVAPLLFVSPTQINYLMPAGTAAGGAAVTVASGDGKISTGAAIVATVAPGLFTADSTGRGVAAALVLRVRPDGSRSYEDIFMREAATGRLVARPLEFGADDLYLELYGTGIRYRSSEYAVTVRIGGVSVPVLYAGKQGGWAGLDQVNIQLPKTLAGRGEGDLVLTVDGKDANTVRVNIK